MAFSAACAAGYTFDLQLQANTPVYEISFTVVPEPTTAGLFTLAGLALAVIRRR